MPHAVGGFLLTVARRWMTNIITLLMYMYAYIMGFDTMSMCCRTTILCIVFHVYPNIYTHQHTYVSQCDHSSRKYLRVYVYVCTRTLSMCSDPTYNLAVTLFGYFACTHIHTYVRTNKPLQLVSTGLCTDL